MNIFQYSQKQTNKHRLFALLLISMLMALSTAYAQPPVAATLTSPSGSLGSDSPTYTWNAVSNASWYFLWVDDSSGNVIKQWYRASEAGCASGHGTCSVTPGTALNHGAGRWWIQTWNDSDGYGPWSNAMSFAVGASLGAAALVAPQDDITLATPKYSWNAVASASWYYLWVNDSSGNVIKQWYRASEVGCGSGSGTCSVTHAISLNQGAGQWWIQTWNADGYGPWSSAMSFNLGGGNHIEAVSTSSNGNSLELRMTGAFLQGSHFSFFLDTDNDPNTGYNGTNSEIRGADYVVQEVTQKEYGSAIWYRYPEGAHGWKWEEVTWDPGFSSDSTQARTYIPLFLFAEVPGPIKGKPRFIAQVSTSDWKKNTYSQWREYQLYGPSWQPKLIGPEGDMVDTLTPDYGWRAVPGANGYTLWVSDNTGNVIQQRFKSSEVGCESGTGVCSVIPATRLESGTVQWKVQPWLDTAHGPWSDTMIFDAHVNAYPIDSISASDDGNNLSLQMMGQFPQDSYYPAHFSFYIDADNNPDTGYRGQNKILRGTDYLVDADGNGLYQYSEKAEHDWEKISTEITFEFGTTQVQAQIPLHLLHLDGSIRYLAADASEMSPHWNYSQVSEHYSVSAQSY